MTDLSVLVLARGFGSVSTGPGKYATVLVNGLRRKGCDVTVVNWGTTHKRLEDSSLDVIHIPRPTLDLRHGNWMVCSFHFRGVLEDILQKSSFDIIHFGEAREALFFRHRTNDCVVGSLHDYLFARANFSRRDYEAVYPLDYRRRLLYYNFGHLLEGRILRRFDQLIADSKATAGYVREGYHIQPDLLSVVHNGIEAEPVASTGVRQEPGDPAVLFIGNNFQGKGLPVLIRASRLVLAERRQTKFLVVGTDPRAEPAMRGLCSRYGVSERFDFRGLIPHHRLHELYTTARVLAQPSLVDSFPYTVLEAMSWGVPSIATNTGGMPEVIQHGENGFLIEPHDHRALARYILLLIEHEDTWKEMKRSCRRVVQNFSVDEMVNRTVRVYERGLT